MNWSMPRPVLMIVASALALIAIGSFVTAAMNAPQRGRLPGEGASVKGVVPLQATEFTPLTDDRLEGAPPPVELTPEEKAKLEADKKAKEDLAAAAKLAEATAATTVAPPTPIAAQPPTDKVGDLLDSVIPPPDEPPH